MGSPQSAGGPSPRCLGKLQLFRPAFEICPFETELNMDIAAALKVRLVALSGLIAQSLPCTPQPPWLCPYPRPGPTVPNTSLPALPPLTALPRWPPLQRGNREWYEELLNTLSPREQVRPREGMSAGGGGRQRVGAGRKVSVLGFLAAGATAPCRAGQAGRHCLRGPAVLLRHLRQPLPQVGPGPCPLPLPLTRASSG